MPQPPAPGRYTVDDNATRTGIVVTQTTPAGATTTTEFPYECCPHVTHCGNLERHGYRQQFADE